MAPGPFSRSLDLGYLNWPGGQGLLHTVSSSCEELTLPFLVVVCWNFGWFSFLPDSWQMMVPRSLVHPSGALAANAGTAMAKARRAVATNIVMRLITLSSFSLATSVVS